MPRPQRLVVYGFNQMAAENVKRVALAADKRGWTVIEGVAVEPVLALLLWSWPDVILTGLSSFQNQYEIALGDEAARRGVPWVVLADTHEVFARPPARGHVARASAVVASPLEVPAAFEFGYGHALYLGGPPVWQDFWQPLEQEQPATTATIYVCGVKSIPITNDLLDVVVAGATRHYGQRWQLIFRPHQKEGTGPDAPKSAAEAEAWRERRRQIIHGVTVVGRTEELAASVAISSRQAFSLSHASFFTSGSTETIQGAIRRLPVGYYESPAVRERMTAQTGKPAWWPAEVGAVIKVENANDVAAVLHMISDDDARVLVQGRQAAAYPKPAVIGNAEERILDFLTGIALGRWR